MEKNRRYFVLFVLIMVVVFQVAFFAALFFLLMFHTMTYEEWNTIIDMPETPFQQGVQTFYFLFETLTKTASRIILLLLFWTRKPGTPKTKWSQWLIQEFLPISWKQKFAVIGVALVIGVPVTWYVQTHFWCYTPWVAMLSTEFHMLADLALVLIGLRELRGTD